MSIEKTSSATSRASHCYTPGPWEVREADGLFAIAHPRGWVLESNNEQQDRADARLIAAAPDLLEAAKSVSEEWEQTGDVSVVRFAELRDAITKAIGG